MENQILATALQAIEQGYSILPIRPYDETHGDKRPALNWKQLQTNPLTREEVTKYFTNNTYGLAVIMGKCSNNLLMIELEGRAANQLSVLTQLAADSGISHIWNKLFSWCEQSPSGGWHFYLKAPGNTHGNRKLARTTTGEVLAETRENGGYSIIAPTDGKFHHTNKPWTIVQGNPTTAQTVTLEELDTIFTIFHTLNETPTLNTTTPTTATTNTAGTVRDKITPGDDYENKTSWADILTPHGWQIVSKQGQETYWRRPGKNQGISASTGHANDRDRLYVWSTSTSFEPETSYTKFAAYTLLNHNGDYRKAASQLAKEGYGTPTPHTNTLDTFINTKTTTPTTSEPNPEPDIYTQTDDGNALRFADTYKNQYAYIPEHHTWAKWNGHKWETTTAEPQAIQAALHLARTLPETTKTDRAHKKRALSKTGITNMLHLASTHPNILKPLTLFDANPYQLNTPTGIVNLRTRQITPPTPAQHCLRSTNAAPKNMPTPCWDNFLADTFAGEPQLTEYIQKFLGMTLIGQVREQIFAFFNGSGANGKSTLLNVIQKILGTNPDGYTASIPSNVFVKGAENRHPTEIASLQGVRLAITSETEEGQYFAEARIKLLTGADNISARFMHGDFFTFTPSHTIIMVSNHEPEVASGGDAFWRRVRKIPFLNTVPVEKRDPELENRLMSEAEGILAWLIHGCHQYLIEGLQEPDVVKLATREYERDQNTVAQFLTEACVVHESNKNLFNVRVAQLRSRYEQWCRVNGLDPVGSRTLGNQLKKAGIESVSTHAYRYYSGISFKADFENLMDGVL